MPEPNIEIDSASIVLLGAFNPQIFHPAWFKANDIIRAEEADKAQVKIIHPEIAFFEVDWLSVEVSQNRFQAIARHEAHHIFLPDLVVKIFTLLEHTPLNAMGLNRQMHFKMASEEEWHAFGDFLAPKDAWVELFDKRPGLLSLYITGQRNMFQLNIRIEPSHKVQFGVFVEANHHYDKVESKQSHDLLAVLRDNWSVTEEYAMVIARHLVQKCIERR